jgi:hypothetical protein
MPVKAKIDPALVAKFPTFVPSPEKACFLVANRISPEKRASRHLTPGYVGKQEVMA